MKTFMVAAWVVALAALAAADDLYIVDNVDWPGLFRDKSKWDSHLRCYMDKEPCGDLQQLKEGVVQRLTTKCGQCTPAQLEYYTSVLQLLKDMYPGDYQNMVDYMAKHYG